MNTQILVNFQRTISLLTIIAMYSPYAIADDSLADKERQAIRAAVDRVAPSVVRIETIGGMERVDDVLFGTGPTTGLIVDPAGYVVSSVFNFVNQPESILVRLPDGTRKAARLIATDRSRMIVLLKIDVTQPLPLPVIAPQSELRVGQWTIAVGRAFEADTPNVAVGILSAVGRVWGKALQTDAAISPNNYGGPLIDLEGRVLGLLAPLSPEADSEVSGIEWYDSGIGFAIPAKHLWKILPRLKRGENLDRGLLGVNFHSRDLYAEPPTISVVYPRSPADEAGLRAADQIVEIEGRPIKFAVQVREEINCRYAGDKLHVTVLRDKKRLTREATLVAKLPPYEAPSLGLLLMRPTEAAKETQAGVVVRWVQPQGPAAQGGIQPGDHLVMLNEKMISNRDDVVEQLAGLQPNIEVTLNVQRNGQKLSLPIRLGKSPQTAVPNTLPPAHEVTAPRKESAKQSRPKTGVIPIKLPETTHPIWACVPSQDDPAVARGVLIWLHGTGEFEPQQFVRQWQGLCNQYDLIVVAPQAPEESKWQTSDLRLIRQLIEEISVDYTVDPARIAVAGQGTGARVAWAAAFRFRELIRGVALLDGSPIEQFPATTPAMRTMIYIAQLETSRFTPEIQKNIAQLREAGYPVTAVHSSSATGNLPPPEQGELVRWVDMLDQL